GAFIEGDTGDDGDVIFSASGKQFVFRILVEDVVDDLNGIEQACPDSFHAVCRLPAIDADSEGTNFATGQQFFQRRSQARVVEPSVFPGVKLNQVQRVDANVGQAFVDVFNDVFRR